jgi:hypothetical protein
MGWVGEDHALPIWYSWFSLHVPFPSLPPSIHSFQIKLVNGYVIVLFIAINIFLVISWGMQLNKEEKKRRIEGMREEARWWDKLVGVLEEEWRVVESVSFP